MIVTIFQTVPPPRLSCLTGNLDLMETAPSKQPILALPKWECPLPSTRPHPSLPSASGEFNSYDADHREFVRPLSVLSLCLCSFLFSVDPPLHPSWNKGYFSIFAFSTLGTPGAKQSSFSHTKGKRPGYLPLST